jgi:hypothetical protein
MRLIRNNVVYFPAERSETRSNLANLLLQRLRTTLKHPVPRICCSRRNDLIRNVQIALIPHLIGKSTHHANVVFNRHF